MDTISNDVRNILSDEDVEVYLHLYVMLYADDTIVMAESTDDLQRALNATYSYCDRWKLTVNTNKTKVVVFSRGKIRNKPKFNFGRDTLEFVDSYVYLGILFNYNGNHKKCIAKQVSQARKALYSMLSKVCRLKLPVDIQCDLFEKLVLPILLYDCEIWGCDDITQVEVFYRKFLKGILNVASHTPSCMIYGETGARKLAHTVRQRTVAFWCRLVSGKQNKLSVIMYKLLKGMDADPGIPFKSKWIALLQSTLNNAGFNNIWSREMDGFSSKYIKQALKLRLDDMFKQEWHDKMFNNNQCTNYRMFKGEPIMEDYLLRIE